MTQLRLDPEPGILIESLRDIGYSFNSALADIIDNSITAGASSISVSIIPSDDLQVTIADNGNGLDRDELQQAMRLGSTDPRAMRKENDLGRFGLGLKTASFSQCRKLTVASKKNGIINAFTWDLDLVVETNEWVIAERTDVDSIPYIDTIKNGGTLVLWEKVDRLAHSEYSGKINFTRVISEAQDHLALVFHRFLAHEHGLPHISIRVNNYELDPIDPFNSKHSATQRSPEDVLMANVSLQSFTLPHRTHYTSSQEYERYGLPGGYLRNQGVYLYRAGRLILYGTWFGIAKKTALTELTRVKIDIDVNQDELWKVDVKKVSAQLPEKVRSRLKALIDTIGAPSKKTYKRRAQRLTSSEVYPAWSVEKSGDVRFYRINREHPIITAFYESLEEENKKGLSAVLSLIESAFPTEALFYDLANNESKVTFEKMGDAELNRSIATFFAELQQQGLEEERILTIMKNAEPFASNWDCVLKALDIEEE